MSELQKAKLAVMRTVPYLQKREAKDLSYTFAGEADLIHKLRPAMIEHGISVAPTAVKSLHRVEGRTTRKGDPWVHVQAIVEYTFSHESGESQTVEAIAEAQDMSDKACNKAMTIGLKYALRQFFLIETGDDPDLVNEFADDPISDMLRAAVKKLERCKTADETASQMERIRTATVGGEPDAPPLFTEEQLAELERMASMHIKKLDNGK